MFTDCVLWILSSGGLLRSDWLPPNRIIAHYHKVNLISTLLDALIIQNAPRRSRRSSPRLTLNMNDFRPLWRSRRVRCERTVRVKSKITNSCYITFSHLADEDIQICYIEYYLTYCKVSLEGFGSSVRVIPADLTVVIDIQTMQLVQPVWNRLKTKKRL